MNLNRSFSSALCLATILIATTSAAWRAEAIDKTPLDDIDMAAELIQQDNALRTRVEMDLAAAKSRKDLNALIAKSDARTAPLMKLSAKDRSVFLSSLKFNDRGLAEFDLSIVRKLSPTDAFSVLSLFGLQGSAGKISRSPELNETDTMINALPKIQAGFLEGYRCLERATCSKEDSKACTSNC